MAQGHLMMEVWGQGHPNNGLLVVGTYLKQPRIPDRLVAHIYLDDLSTLELACAVSHPPLPSACMLFFGVHVPLFVCMSVCQSVLFVSLSTLWVWALLGHRCHVMAHTPQLCHQGHALWSHYRARLLRMQHSLRSKHPLQIAVGVKAFPADKQGSTALFFKTEGCCCVPLWKSQEHSPPFRGDCYLLAPGACPKQFTNPLPVCPLVVWEGMHVHEVD